MRKGYLLAAFLLLAAMALALPGPDLSGKWVFDKTKSDPVGFGRGGPGGAGGGGDVEITLTIKQAANEIVIARQMTMGGNTRESEQTFPLDGTEVTVPGMMGRGEMKATAKWDKDSLVVDGKQTVERQGETMEIKTHDVYSLSADGNILTITQTRTTPQGERTSKQVFNKQ